jgi:hypothetical protein
MIVKKDNQLIIVELSDNKCLHYNPLIHKKHRCNESIKIRK